MKKILLNYYIGLLTLETENLCTTYSWPFARSLTRCRRYFFFFALHSPLIYALRTTLRVAGAELWGPNRFSNCLFYLWVPFLPSHPSSSNHSCAKWAPQIMECSVGCKKSARLTWTNLIHWRRFLSSFGKKWVECPVLFELLQDPTTHCFTNVKTGKYSCRKLDNTRVCQGPKDVFDFRWAEIPLVASQQRWWNQNGGRSELSQVISRGKMRLYRRKHKRFMKYFRYTFYSYQTKL